MQSRMLQEWVNQKARPQLWNKPFCVHFKWYLKEHQISGLYFTSYIIIASTTFCLRIENYFLCTSMYFFRYLFTVSIKKIKLKSKQRNIIWKIAWHLIKHLLLLDMILLRAKVYWICQKNRYNKGNLKRES